MAVLAEDPIVTTGPWALTATLSLGVVGGRRLRDRVARSVPTMSVGPRSDPEEVVRSVDAIVVALSTFDDPSGAWAYALRPVGFDRGQALARLLAAAAATDRPVLTLDDRASRRTDPWTDHLLARVDDVAVLGPLLPGAVSWNPGCHLDPVALALVGASGGHRPPAETTPEGWRTDQRAAATGRSVDGVGEGPWARHLAAEVDELRRRVCDPGATRPTDLASPAVAVAALCARLGLPAPAAQPPLVLLGHEPVEFERAELDAAVPGAVVRGPGASLGDERSIGLGVPVVLTADDRPLDATAIAAALALVERTAQEVPVAVPARGVAVGTEDQLTQVGADRADRWHLLADAAVTVGAV